MGLMGQSKGAATRIVVDGLDGVVGLLDKVSSLEKRVTSLQTQLVDMASVLSAMVANSKGTAPSNPVTALSKNKPPAKKKPSSRRK